MDIVLAMILSIGVKAIGAVLEVAIQASITNGAGVSEYGNYTFFVSVVEGAYFVLFSGSVKLNTYYLSTPESSLNSFKRKYRLRYISPIIGLIIICFAIMRNPFGVLSGIVLFVYYQAYDNISIFYARGQQLIAMIGEYLFGRIVLLVAVITTVKIDIATGTTLFVLYGLQFLAIVVWFMLHRNKIKDGTDEIKVPMKKLFEYQVSDVANSFIAYSPTILQYIVGGAFSAGFLGIVTIVKRFINFISGPTAKIFLPEFSKHYKQGHIDQLQQSYLMIVRIQMVFIGIVGSILIGFPHLFLKMFSPDLIQYTDVFTLTSICIMFVSGIGPVTGLLQMTGNEHICNRNQYISIGAMVITWCVLYQNPLFGLYGMCVQIVVEGVLKYYSVCRWFGKNIVPIKNYLLLWLPVGVIHFIVSYFNLHYSIVALFISAAVVFIWNMAFALQDPMIKEFISEKMKNTRKQRNDN